MNSHYYGKSSISTDVPSKFKTIRLSIGGRTISLASRQGEFQDKYVWFMRVSIVGGFQVIKETTDKFQFLYFLRCAGADLRKERTQNVFRAIELGVSVEEYLRAEMDNWAF